MSSHLRDYGMIKLDSDGNIALELSCSKCDYDLRGLSPDGNCPECGYKISATIREARQNNRRSYLPHIWLVSLSFLSLALTFVFQLLYERNHMTRTGPIRIYYQAAVAFSFAGMLIAIVSIILLMRARRISLVPVCLICILFSMTSCSINVIV